MKTKRTIAAIAAMTLGVALTGCSGASGKSAEGKDYPSGPTTVTAPADPGSGWDTTARALVKSLKKEDLVSKPLPVQNRPGATGSVWLAQTVHKRKGKDNYISMTSLPIMSNQIRGRTEYGYQDVTMLGVLYETHYIVVVPADSPYKNLDDLMKAVKKNPKSVPVGAAGDDRLPFGMLAKAGGANPKNVNFINYEGGGDEITALLNGDVKAAVAGVSEFRGQLEAGKLRGLAVVADKPLSSKKLSEIPTATSQGYDVTVANWRGVYGPPDMPDYAVKYWQKTLKKVEQTKTWKDFAEKNQWDINYMTGQKMKKYLDTTNTDIKKALKSIGQAGSEG